MIWRGALLKAEVNKVARITLEKACVLVKGTAKKSIGKVKAPSSPGHAPATVTGTLKRSIAHELSPTKLEGKVGTNIEYGRRLELGFIGVDSKGRRYNQAPRPYLRPALHKCEAAIALMFKKVIH